MPFIGNQPALSYTSFAKQDFTTSATTSYTLDHPVANQNELALFINFVRQEPTTAYTASGTSLTLTSATSASDDMYCVFLGKAVQTVNPPNGSVGLSQLSATGTKDSTTFLRGDNTFDTPPLGGITQADQWRMSANRGNGVNSDITANLERVDDGSFGYIGSGMTESSGIFTFPATGIYQVSAVGMIYSISDSSTFLEMYVTTNNSSYDIVVNMNGGNNNSGATNLSIGGHTLVDVTDTSNVKVKFATSSMGGSSSLSGDTTSNYTYFTFIRLGDT